MKTPTLDFGTVGAGADVEIATFVNGVFNTGDEIVVVSAPTLETGLVASGYVSNVNQVTIRVSNVTAAPVDPADQQYNLAVIQ